MRKLLILSTLIFSLMMFSSTSFAEWTKVGENVGGRTYYLDFERIRKHGGYVYWWELGDYLKPSKYGHLSGALYKQGDCKLFRYKVLSASFHKEPMGGGTGQTENHPVKDWRYPSPHFVDEVILKLVCSR